MFSNCCAWFSFISLICLLNYLFLCWGLLFFCVVQTFVLTCWSVFPWLFKNLCWITSVFLLSWYWHIYVFLKLIFENFVVLGMISNFPLKPGCFCVMFRGSSLNFCFSWFFQIPRRQKKGGPTFLLSDVGRLDLLDTWQESCFPCSLLWSLIFYNLYT